MPQTLHMCKEGIRKIRSTSVLLRGVSEIKRAHLAKTVIMKIVLLMTGCTLLKGAC